MPFPHTVFKNLFLSAIGELRTLEHEMTVLLAWYLAINTGFSFVATLSQEIDFAAYQVSGSKSGLVILGWVIWSMLP